MFGAQGKLTPNANSYSSQLLFWRSSTCFFLFWRSSTC